MNAKSTHARNILTQYTHKNEYNCYVNQLEFLFHSKFAIYCQYIYITIKIWGIFVLFFFFAAINKQYFSQTFAINARKKINILF